MVILISISIFLGLVTGLLIGWLIIGRRRFKLVLDMSKRLEALETKQNPLMYNKVWKPEEWPKTIVTKEMKEDAKGFKDKGWCKI